MTASMLIPPSQVHSIQVFHLTNIGDMVFSLPMLASLRHAFPKAHIASIMRPATRDIWEMSHLGDEYLLRATPATWASRMALVRAVRKRHPELAVLISQSPEARFLAKLSGARVRVGFRRTFTEGLGLTHWVHKDSPPSTANNARLLECIGVPPVRADYVGLLVPPHGERIRMGARLRQAGVSAMRRLVVLAPGTSAARTIKEWTDEGFAAVADHFAAQPGTSVAIVGTAPADGIVRLAQRDLLDLTRQTNLRELAALLDMADVVIGVDSGVIHVAAALATPVVAIHGPTDPAATGPQGIGHRIARNPVPCSPCLQKTCAIGRICLTDLQPRTVIELAEEVLQTSAASEESSPTQF